MKPVFHLLLILLCLLGGSTAVCAQDYLPLCPAPAEQEVHYDQYVPLKTVAIACPDQEAASWAESHLASWYGEQAPKVRNIRYKEGTALPAEGYNLSTDEGGAEVQAATLQGVRYALYTLRQLAIPQRGTATVQGWIVPTATIADAPTLDFRGIHICWFPETEPWEVERQIRLAAYYKLNYAVIEPWGTFRSKVAPWYGWPDGQMTSEEVHRLKGIADDLGITLIPQLNVFGHASMCRDGAGKHAGLDFHPEYQPLFEPSAGWNWCLSNPATRKLLTDLIDEMMALFGNPPYFHLGCDEANAPSCPLCAARPYAELFVEHLTAMQQAVARHGARPMMWHDMLLDGSDARWNGFVHNGTPETVQALDEMPKDIIVCDWYYGGRVEEYPSLSYFKDKGFAVLTCPWDNLGGIDAQGRQAGQLALYGMLGTLWHHNYGQSLKGIYTHLANAAWGAPDDKRSFSMHMFYTHLRQIGWDMQVSDRRQTGIFQHDVHDETVQD